MSPKYTPVVRYGVYAQLQPAPGEKQPSRLRHVSSHLHRQILWLRGEKQPEEIGNVNRADPGQRLNTIIISPQYVEKFTSTLTTNPRTFFFHEHKL